MREYRVVQFSESSGKIYVKRSIKYHNASTAITINNFNAFVTVICNAPAVIKHTAVESSIQVSTSPVITKDGLRRPGKIKHRVGMSNESSVITQKISRIIAAEKGLWIIKKTLNGKYITAMRVIQD